MEQWKELQLLKASDAASTLGVAWPELAATGLSRDDVAAYLVAFGENGAVKSVDFASVKNQADCKVLQAGGLTVSWQVEKKKGKKEEEKSAAAKKGDDAAEEKKKDEEEGAADKEEPAAEDAEAEKQTDEEKESPKPETAGAGEQKEEAEAAAEPDAAGKCVANTAITGDRRAHAVAAGLRALLQLDKDSPDATKANVINVAPADAKSELSPAFAPAGGIRVTGVIYKSPDHYLAAQKAELFGTNEDRDKIMNAPTAEAARKLGMELESYDETKWHEHRPEAVFAAVIAAVYATRRNYYSLITSGNASFACDTRPAWAIGLQDARLFLMCRDFGAHLFNHPNIGFTVNNRITLLGGIKGHGVKIQSLCEDCLAKPRAIGSWQRLLYSLRHGRNLAASVNRSGVILLISDLLYKESTDPDIVRLAINVCAALAEELGYLDKEVVGFLIKYYLSQRDTWSVLGSLETLHYSDDVSKQAYSIFFGGKGARVDKNDIYHRTHAAKVLSKLLTSPKATVLAQRMSSPDSVNLLIDTLANCQYHSSLGGWNDLISDLSTACMKCLLLIGKHLASKKEDLSFFVPKVIPFLSCVYNDQVQSHCAVLLEKTQSALNDEAVAAVVALVQKEFVDLKLQAPDKAEDLCDLLVVLSPRSEAAATLLFDLGTKNFATWAMPVLTTTHTAIKNKSALSKTEGFYAKVAAVLKQALDHSDESAIEDLASFADAVSQSEAGVTALQDVGFLSPLLQWVTEVDEEEQTQIQDSLGMICQRLTKNVLVAEENSHILQLMIDVLVDVHRPKAQNYMLQGFLNLVAAGTTRATFESIINLQQLNKTMLGKQNQVTTTKLLTQLGVKTEAKEPKEKTDKKPDAARTQGSKKGEVDTMAFQSNSDNPFQLLVASRKPQADDAAANGKASSPKTGSKSSAGEAKALKGFTLISAKKHKDKDSKKKSTHASSSAATAGQQQGKYSQRVSVKKSAPSKHEGKYSNEGKYGSHQDRHARDDDRAEYQRRPPAHEEAPRKGPAAPQAVTTGPVSKFRDQGVVKPGGGVAVNYAKEGRGTAVAEDTGARVFKAQQAKGKGGVNLSKLNMEMSSATRREEKKPTTWAGVAKFANEREAREERAEREAAEQKRLMAEERERIDNMRRKATAVAPPSIDPVSELFKKLLPGGAAVRSVVSTDRDLAEVEADKRKMEHRQAERERLRQQEEERREMEVKRQAEAERLAALADRQRREQEQRQQQEERERMERAERERQEGLRKAREDAERAAAAVSGGGLSWNQAQEQPLPQQQQGYDAKTAAAIKSGWDTTPATINNQQHNNTWGAPGIPAAQPAPLGRPGGFGAPGGFGGIPPPQNAPFGQQGPPRHGGGIGGIPPQQWGGNNNTNQGPVGGRQGSNTNHPWQMQQQQAQQVQQHWQGQQAQFRVQQQGGDQRGPIGAPGGFIPPPMHQPNQGVPAQQMQQQQQHQQQGGGANANYYQTSQGQGNNNVRLNPQAGVFSTRLN